VCTGPSCRFPHYPLHPEHFTSHNEARIQLNRKNTHRIIIPSVWGTFGIQLLFSDLSRLKDELGENIWLFRVTDEVVLQQLRRRRSLLWIFNKTPANFVSQHYSGDFHLKSKGYVWQTTAMVVINFFLNARQEVKNYHADSRLSTL
jgi:hypothetical protein